MLCFHLLVFFCCGISFAELSVSFPDDSPTNGSIQTRSNGVLLKKWLKGLDSILGGDTLLMTQTAEAMPPATADRQSTDTLPTFSPIPVFSSSMQPPNGMTFPPSTGIPGVLETQADMVPTRCECMPVEVCKKVTAKDKVTKRIVTRPPVGIVCGPGEVYCCIETPKHGCGIPNIVPGVNPKEGQADLGEFPWSAIILTNDNVYVGGGVLIDATHVLTAAHKVARYGNGAGLKIRLGDWDLSNEDEPVGFIEVKISKIVNHPRYEATTLKNDISVITLASPVATLTRPHPQINNICLPESTAVFVGSRCRVAGWGKDRFNGQYQNIMKEVEVPVLSNADCQSKLRKTRLGSGFVLDTNSFICAGGELNRDACTGDGGNALACLRNGQYYLAGITAGGIECGNENVPGLYVNMVNYLTWVQAQITGNNGGIDPRRKPT